MDATLRADDPGTHRRREGAHRTAGRGRRRSRSSRPAATPTRPSTSWRRQRSSVAPGCSSATSPSGPSPGSYRLTSRSGAPIVVVRGEDGELRAFYNACRHRGAPVTRDECGTARRLTCQYHSWSYGTDGTLKSVPDARSFVDLDTGRTGPGARCAARPGTAGSSSARTPMRSRCSTFLGPIADADGRDRRPGDASRGHPGAPPRSATGS